MSSIELILQWWGWNCPEAASLFNTTPNTLRTDSAPLCVAFTPPPTSINRPDWKKNEPQWIGPQVMEVEVEKGSGGKHWLWVGILNCKVNETCTKNKQNKFFLWKICDQQTITKEKMTSWRCLTCWPVKLWRCKMTSLVNKSAHWIPNYHKILIFSPPKSLKSLRAARIDELAASNEPAMKQRNYVTSYYFSCDVTDICEWNFIRRTSERQLWFWLRLRVLATWIMSSVIDFSSCSVFWTQCEHGSSLIVSGKSVKVCGELLLG